MENSIVLQLSEIKFKDLSLCFCGYAECESCHNFGPAVRPNYIIHFVLEGKGIYQVLGRRYELQAGQGFIIEPEVSTFYEADKKYPWKYIWIGFWGNHAKEYVKDLGLNSEQLIFQSERGSDLEKIVWKMLKVNKSSISEQYILQSLLYEFFAILMKDMIIVDGAQQELKESFYVKEAITFIKNHFSNGIKVSDIANAICINRSYLYKLFKKNLNVSPQEFLTKFRISRAKELLIVTQLSIESIAFSCGYKDTLVFSKAFRKVVGVAPSVYRKRNQEIREKQRIQNRNK